MNETSTQQLTVYLNIDGVNSQDAITINAICSQVIASTEYMAQLTNSLNTLFNAPTFDIVTEIAQVILNLQTLSKNTTYCNTITTTQMKYVLYISLYTYLQQYQQSIFKTIDWGIIRLVWTNAFELVYILPQSVQIMEKTCTDSCSSCLGWSTKVHI